jgi:hypothetical protein
MKNIENEVFYHPIYKKLRRMQYKTIVDLKAGKSRNNRKGKII